MHADHKAAASLASFYGKKYFNGLATEQRNFAGMASQRPLWIFKQVIQLPVLRNPVLLLLRKQSPHRLDVCRQETLEVRTQNEGWACLSPI